MNVYICLTILIIILLLLIINKSLYNKYIENFKIYHNVNDLVINNCKKNFATDLKIDKSNEDVFCVNSAFVTKPNLLAGICGGINNNDNKPLYAVKNNNNNNLYYGCINTENSDLNWNLDTSKYDYLDKIKLTKKMGHNLTIKNIKISNLVLFLSADNICTIEVNNINYDYNNVNTLQIINIPNVANNTLIKINIKNYGKICLSYIWNGQLYIQKYNGYNSSINIFNVSISPGKYNFIANDWKSKIPTLPPFMNRWINTENKDNTTISLYTGKIRNIPEFMNVMTVFIAINGNAVIKIKDNNNYRDVYNYRTPNKFINFDIHNVLLTDELYIYGDNKKLNENAPILTIAYVYNSNIFVLNDNSINNRNIINASNLLNFNCNNWNGKFSDNNSIKVPPFMTSWICSEKDKNNFVFKTKIGEGYHNNVEPENINYEFF